MLERSESGRRVTCVKMPRRAPRYNMLRLIGTSPSHVPSFIILSREPVFLFTSRRREIIQDELRKEHGFPVFCRPPSFPMPATPLFMLLFPRLAMLETLCCENHATKMPFLPSFTPAARCFYREFSFECQNRCRRRASHQ